MTKKIFLTGATGVIGSAFLEALLKNTEYEALVLLRANSSEELAQRENGLQADLSKLTGLANLSTRLKAVRGDVTLPNLGIEESDFQSIAKNANAIIHCAANVSMKMSDSEAEKISINATRSILELSSIAQKNGQFEKLEYVSTLGVAGQKRGEIEEIRDLGAREFNTSYESSKAGAEELVFASIDDGMPITVHRPSMVIGNSGSGQIRQFQVFYYICEFLSGKYTGGYLPNTGDVTLDTIPVDFVANALLKSLEDPKSVGQITHLCGGPDRSMTVLEIAQEVSQVFSSVRHLSKQRIIPLWLFRSAAKIAEFTANEKARKSIKNLPLLLVHIEANQRFQNQSTYSLLGSDLMPPQANSYVSKSLEFYINSKDS